MNMSVRPKILLLDDDPDVLELYTELLSKLPSQPEIHQAASGGRAVEMLTIEPYSLLLCDLKMPNMDGLQVLAIVRRRFPHLRTAVLTAMTDEQFRMRAYAIGLDLYLEKPRSDQELGIFLDCVESLLGPENHRALREVPSKNILDRIQLECLSRNSLVLKVNRGGQEGRIWFQDGDILDAVTGELQGNAAFQRIVSWSTGNFEILPAESGHVRRIIDSYQTLLQTTVREWAEAGEKPVSLAAPAEGLPATHPLKSVSDLAAFKGVEFALRLDGEAAHPIESWAMENPKPAARWMQQTLDQFGALGKELQAGQLTRVEGFGLQHHAVLVPRPEDRLGIGFNRNLSSEQIRATVNIILTRWGS